MSAFCISGSYRRNGQVESGGLRVLSAAREAGVKANAMRKVKKSPQGRKKIPTLGEFGFGKQP